MLIPKVLVAIAWAIIFGLAIGLPFGWGFSQFHRSAEQAKPYDQAQPAEAKDQNASPSYTGAASDHGQGRRQPSHQEGNWYDTFLDHMPDWFVALFTGVLSLVTLLLVRSTNRLWEAGERQIRVAQDAAIAAKQSADTAKDGLLKLQRAFVTHQGMRYLSHTRPDDTVWWSLHFNWHNSGASPAQKVRFHVSRYFEGVDLPSSFDFVVPDDRPSVFMGPQSSMTSGGLSLTADELMAVRENKKFLYFWGRVDYQDIFDGTPDHVTKFSIHVRDFRGDPAKAWDDKTNIVELVTNASPSRHNCADEGCN